MIIIYYVSLLSCIASETDLTLLGLAEVPGWCSCIERHCYDCLVCCGKHLSPSDLQYHHNKSQVRVLAIFTCHFIDAKLAINPSKD